MSGDFRATPEQWQRLEGIVKTHDWSLGNCTLELRARVEALEAAQQPTVKESLTDQTAPVATRELWELWHRAERPTDAFRAVYNLGRQHGAAQATCPHIVSSDEGTSYCRLAEQGAAPATEDSSVPAPTGSLVERMSEALSAASLYEDQNAAILTAATWLRKRGHASAASALERELGR